MTVPVTRGRHDRPCDTWQASLDDIDFPSSVEALITSRMDRLPVTSQLLMKVLTPT